MIPPKCNIGELRKFKDGIVNLTITCRDEEITRSQMIETVKAIDSIAEKPSPLLVDVSQPHSVSFDALIEMAKAKNVVAVAMYAPSETSKEVAKYIENIQNMIEMAPYPFKVFSDSMTAIKWLRSF